MHYLHLIGCTCVDFFALPSLASSGLNLRYSFVLPNVLHPRDMELDKSLLRRLLSVAQNVFLACNCSS